MKWIKLIVFVGLLAMIATGNMGNAGCGGSEDDTSTIGGGGGDGGGSLPGTETVIECTAPPLNVDWNVAITAENDPYGLRPFRPFDDLSDAAIAVTSNGQRCIIDFGGSRTQFIYAAFGNVVDSSTCQLDTIVVDTDGDRILETTLTLISDQMPNGVTMSLNFNDTINYFSFTIPNTGGVIVESVNASCSNQAFLEQGLL